MKKFRTIIFCLFNFACTICCSAQPSVRIHRKALDSPNVTSHIFQLPIKILEDTLRPIFADALQWFSPVLKQVFFHNNKGISMPVTFEIVTAKDSANFYNVDDYFKKRGRKNDVILDSGVFPWDSPLYYWRKKPLPYIAAFILKLKSINAGQTLLTIEPQNPQIFLCTFFWTQCTTCGIDVMDLRTAKVRPTTIEEHVLLQYIADKVGDYTVEPLKLPPVAFAKSK